jgi:hypothetical protein
MSRRKAPAEAPMRLRRCDTCRDEKWCAVRPQGPPWTCSTCGGPRTRLARDPYDVFAPLPPDYDDPPVGS